MGELSEVDKAIIHFLLTSGTGTYPTEIARRIGKNKGGVNNRCKLLHEKGILQSKKGFVYGREKGLYYALDYSIECLRKLVKYPEFVPLLQNSIIVLNNVALKHRWACRYNGVFETNSKYLTILDKLYDLHEDTDELRKSKEDIKEKVISFSKHQKKMNKLAYYALMVKFYQSQSFFELFLNNDADVLEKTASDYFRLTMDGQTELLLSVSESHSFPIEDLVQYLFEHSLLSDMLAGRRNDELINEITTLNEDRAKSKKEACEKAASYFAKHAVYMEIKEILSNSGDALKAIKSINNDFLKKSH